MTAEIFRVGFLPLVDAALPILAQELGFAEEEGVELSFTRDVSWASLLDRLLYGHSDCAHMLAPLAIATTLGRGRMASPLTVPFVLGLNGNAITLSPDLADEIAPRGQLADPVEAGAKLKTLIAMRANNGQRTRFGVVHRYSSHNYKLRYWLSACGIRPDKDVDIITIAPPFAADALASHEVDGICVGEPWNSVAVNRGVGRIVLVNAQIWRRGVEKVLAMPAAHLEERREGVERMIRALHAAAIHFVQPENWQANAAILARPEYLDGSAKLIEHALSDRLPLASHSEPLHIPDFMFQYREAANFPWVSQAAWLYSQMARWDGVDFDPAALQSAQNVFRPDIYRAALTGLGAGLNAPLPAANSKLEGGIVTPVEVPTTQGSLKLSADSFFDQKIFDPAEVEAYIAAQRS